MNKRLLKIVYTALFAALIFVGTQFVRIPLPFGYFNFGDCFILLSSVIIGGPYAVVASALGAVLADILSGYAIYVPATLAVKTCMVIAVIWIEKISENKKRKGKTAFFILAAVVAELIMMGGYYIYDSALYGFAGAGLSVLGNSIQGFCAVIISTLVVKTLEHGGILKHITLQ